MKGNGLLKIPEREIYTDEMRKKMKEYGIFVFEDIFSQYNPKKHTNGMRNMEQEMEM